MLAHDPGDHGADRDVGPAALLVPLQTSERPMQAEFREAMHRGPTRPGGISAAIRGQTTGRDEVVERRGQRDEGGGRSTPSSRKAAAG